MVSSSATSTPLMRKASLAAPDKKYKCQFCHRAFSRSEHRSRHERSHTKERPFKCLKCRSTFVRRDLLLRHDRTVHAKDGGIPLHSDVKRRKLPGKSGLAIDATALEQIEVSSDGMVDIETAAMLMTDLHHKATAHMRSGSADALDAIPLAGFSRGMAAMEPSVTYPSGSVSLPHISWDAFLPQALSESKSQSMNAPFFTSLESTRVMDDASLARQSPSLQLPPIMSRSSMSCNGLVPALQSMIASLPASAASSSDRGSPLGSASKLHVTPRIIDDHQRDLILKNIHSHDIENCIPVSFRLPDLHVLNHFLASYFDFFHHQLPFLHRSSFSAYECPPSLLLAVLSIGALYANDQDAAYMLHIGTKMLVNQFLQNKANFSSRKCPLWIMQSSLLNMMFSSWSGDPKGLEWACSVKSLLANMVAGNRYELKLRTEARKGVAPSRAEWAEDEGCRRTYYAVYIFFGMLTMSFNHTPAISFNEFEDLQLPSTEAQWDASSAESVLNEPVQTFMEAHENLFQGDTRRFSAFAARVMINALFLEVWYHKRSPEALQDVVTEYRLRLALETWEKSLQLCDTEALLPSPGGSSHSHPLILGAMAVFRNTRVRLEVDLKAVQEALRYHDSYEVAAAMSNAQNKVRRSTEMIKVIQECYTCLETAAVGCSGWIAHTAPMQWSVEYSLCGFDLMVILTLWLYRLENDEELPSIAETAMYKKIHSLFDIHTPDAKLSSIVARIWGGMLDKVVVWGIRRLMSESFKLHSLALIGYEVDVGVFSNVSTPSMISQGLDGNDDSVY